MTIRDISSFSNIEVQEFWNEKPVFLVGSAISMFSPTDIPSGQVIGKLMYEYLFPDSIHDKSKSTKSEKKVFRELFDTLPFEAINSCFPSDMGIIANVLQKQFSNKKSNPIHSFLAEKLEKGEISAIVTPNYDHAIDQIVSKSVKVLINENDCKKYNTNPIGPVIFKIHGSLEDASSMIYTLEQEKNLNKDKVETLKILLKDKPLIVFGYSGRDFDILPLIIQKHIYSYKRIYWLHRGELKYISAYGTLLLESHNYNTLLIGDFESFLEKFNKKITLNYKGSTFDIDKDYNLKVSEINSWRLRIMNRLSFGSIGLNMLDAFRSTIDYEFYLNMKWDVHGHRGETLQSINIVKQLRNRAYIRQDWKNYYTYTSTLSGFYLGYGNLFYACYYLRKSKVVLEKHFSSDLEIYFEYMHRKLTFYRELFLTFKIPYFRNVAKSIGITLSKKENYSYQVWDQKQGLQMSIEKLKLEKEVIIPKEELIPLTSRRAYENLGQPNHELLSYRDSLRSNPSSIELRNKYRKYRHEALIIGKYPEVWKLAKLRIDLFNDSKKLKLAYWRVWNIYFLKTENSFFLKQLRKLQLYLYYFKIRFFM